MTIVGIIALGYLYIISAIDSDTASRYTLEAISESDGTGRYELWADAINAFNCSSFFRKICGYGTGAIRDVTYLFYFHRHNVMHNMFVENLIEIGVIGLLFYLIHISSHSMSLYKAKV